VWWTENQWSNWAQRLVISGTKSSWRQVASGVPQDSMLGSILFVIFINDLDDVAELILSKFVEDTRLGGVADTPDGCAAFQRNFNRLEKLTEGNLRKFSKWK